MPKFEILCTTMHQNDFSKLEEMNVHSDIVYANQCDRTAYDEKEFEGHTAKMISTQTRGVGKNRNILLTYASADICLMADDDVTYKDGVEETVLSEFAAHPDADIMIFHIESSRADENKIRYSKTKKCRGFYRMPWGAPRIAFRRDSVQKANVWFTTLFGGGATFPSGEDSMWLAGVKRKGLALYVSDKTIGATCNSESTWFTGYDEKYYFGLGAFYQALRPKTFCLWMLYSVLRTRSQKEISAKEKMKWIKNGKDGYKKMLSYQDYLKTQK